MIGLRRTPSARGGVDLTLLTVTAMLVGIGLIMVYSASSVLAMRLTGDVTYFIKRQILWAAFGFLGMGLLSQVSPARLRSWVVPALVACLALMVAVALLPLGKTGSGARRWFALGPVAFQPAELLKVVLVLYLADMLVRKREHLRHFVPGVLPPLVVAAAAASLLLIQPDFGTAAILALVTLGMLFAAGARLSHLIGLVLTTLPGLVLLIMKVGYRRRRWDAYLDPWQDALGKGFQMVQSYLALGSGGLWGKGLGDSQQKLLYLPAPHTDFIFSILGEELGFAGGLVVIGLFGVFLATGFSIARRCRDEFSKLAAYGLTLLVGVQTVLNLGVATGLVPTKGTPLPFISAGGSSLLCTLAAVGILLALSRRVAEEAG